MMTIDLLYDGSNWVDKEKNKYTSIITVLLKPIPCPDTNTPPTLPNPPINVVKISNSFC